MYLNKTFLCLTSSNNQGEEIELVLAKDETKREEDDQSNISLSTTEAEVLSSRKNFILPIERLAIILLVI